MAGDGKRDLSYLKELDGAGDRLRIFPADLNSPESFPPAIEDCIGVFHVAHPTDIIDKEYEETVLGRVITAAKTILTACAKSGTVKRVVYTSTLYAVTARETYGQDLMEESDWSDVEFVRRSDDFSVPYVAVKTLTEKFVWELGRELGLDLVSVCPTVTTGPFITPYLPSSVKASLSLIYGNENYCKVMKDASIVHIDDVARAHIHLFEYPNSKGRYICCAESITLDESFDIITRLYPEIKLFPPEHVKDGFAFKLSGASSGKLLQTGFVYKYGVEEMIDSAIKCCKDKGFL